jgi:DNA-binding transcriptional LysR family regulator
VWDAFRNRATGEVSLVTFPTAGQMLLPGALQDLAEVEGLVVHCTDMDPELSDFPALTSDFDIVLAHSMRGQVPWGGRGLTVVPLMTEPLDVGLPTTGSQRGHPSARPTWSAKPGSACRRATRSSASCMRSNSRAAAG